MPNIRLLLLLAFLSPVISFANPATTPRIYSTDVIPEVELKELSLDLDLLLGERLEEIRDEIKREDGGRTVPEEELEFKAVKRTIGKDIEANQTEIGKTSDPEKLADLYIVREHLIFLEDFLKDQGSALKVSGASASVILESYLHSNRLPSLWSVDKAKLSEAISEYNNQALKDQKITLEYMKSALAKAKLNGDTNSSYKLLLVLVERKQMLEKKVEFDRLVSELANEDQAKNRKAIIRKYFYDYYELGEISVSEKHVATKTESIAFAENIRKSAGGNENLIWTSGVWDGWLKLNYLHYDSNLSKERLTAFGGFGIGSAENNQTIKIHALEYDMYFNDTFRIPITLYSAEVIGNGDVNEDDVNKAKLLDPEMGTLNLGFSSIAKFRVLDFCKFYTSYGCYLPAQLGVRALRLPSGVPDEDGNVDHEYAFGSYFRIGVNFVFPIMPRRDPNKIAGRMALGVQYAAYHNSGSDLGVIFSDVVDDDGTPVLSGNRYEGINANLLFTITETIEVKAKYFKGSGMAGALGSVTSFELSYSLAPENG